ncbi:hypothetical protein [Vibrio harveyi]|uniref:hypothetical protein n=1 Tax=Vibrio harveyi TaxID=669 RepID=UPI003BB6C976
MEIPTRYGLMKVTRHAIERWKQRTDLNKWDLIGAVLKARRPTKNQLRRISKKESGWRPKRILQCQHAYFIIKGNRIVTVVSRHSGETHHGSSSM